MLVELVLMLRLNMDIKPLGVIALTPLLSGVVWHHVMHITRVGVLLLPRLKREHQ